MKSLIIVLCLAVCGFALAFTEMTGNVSAAGTQYDVEISFNCAKITDSNCQREKSGTWTLGANESPLEVRFASGNGVDKHDGGKTLMGQVKFDQKAGMLALKAERINGNNFAVYTKKGNENWKKDGDWVIGGRNNHAVIKADAKSTDGGKTLIGMITYAGEGPVHFKATRR